MSSTDLATKGRDSLEDQGNRYEKMDKLGEGTYGVVYRARDKETNEVRIRLEEIRINFLLLYLSIILHTSSYLLLFITLYLLDLKKNY